MPALATLLGPIEVKLGLAVGLVALLLVAELATSWLLARLGLAGTGRVARWRPAAALLLPLLLLAPRLEGIERMVPSHQLRAVPGVPDLGAGPWDLLNDAVFQFLPWEAEVRRAIGAGRLPFWSDRLQSSPWSNPQAQVASPVALAARLFPLEHFLLAALALKLLLAFDGAWALAAAVGVRTPFRYLAGVSFALGGGLMAWALFPQSSALVLVPWLAAAAVRLARRNGRAERLAAALATAALAVGGHPEIAVAGGAFTALVALGYRRRHAPLRPALTRLAAAAAIGLALAAPLWLPFAFEVGESQRFVELEAGSLRLPPAPLSWLAAWFHPAHFALLRSPLGPEVFGRPYFGEFDGPFNWVAATSGYAGLAAFAGLAAALAARASRRRALPLALFGLLALLGAARFAPLMALADAIAPLRAIALERALPVATLALAVAGALGAERFARRRRIRTGRVRSLVVRGPRVVVGLFPPFAAFALAAAASLGARATPRTIVIWLLLAAAAALAPRRRALAGLALAAALVADLGLFARDFVPAGFARQLWPPSALLTELARRGGDEPFRVAALGTEAYPASLAMHGLEDVRVHDPLADQRYLDLTGPAFGFAPSTSRYFSAFELRGHPLGSYLGLRFVLARAGETGPPGWRPISVAGEPDWLAYESDEAPMPRVLPAAPGRASPGARARRRLRGARLAGDGDRCGRGDAGQDRRARRARGGRPGRAPRAARRELPPARLARARAADRDLAARARRVAHRGRWDALVAHRDSWRLPRLRGSSWRARARAALPAARPRRGPRARGFRHARSRAVRCRREVPAEARMSLLLFALTAWLATAAAARWVAPIGARARWVLALLPLVATGAPLARGEVYAPIDRAWAAEPLAAARAELGPELRSPTILHDVWTQMIPWRKAVRWSFAHGEWPLWNPFVLAGDPLAPSAVPAAWHPTNLLALALPLAESFTFAAAMTLFLAALAMFLLARDAGCREEVALLAAAGWAYSSYVGFWLEWPQGPAAAATPLFWLGARRVARQPGGPSAGVLGAGGLLLLLSGHPESALFAVAAGAALFVFELAGARPRAPRRALAFGLAGGLAALGLAAIDLFPFADALVQTQQHRERRAIFAKLERAAPLDEALENLRPNAIPFVHGVPGRRLADSERGVHAPAATAYCGSLLVAAALFGLVGARSRLRFWLAGAAIAGALLAVRLPVWTDLVRHLPLFDVSLPGYGYLWAAPAVVLLAALGLERGLDDARSRRLLAATFAASAIAATFAVAAFAPELDAVGLDASFRLAEGAWLVVPLLLGAVVLVVSRTARFAAIALLALVLVQRRGELGHLYQAFPARFLYPAVEPIRDLPRGGEPYRVVGLGYVLQPNSPTMWELEDVRGYNAMTFHRLAEVFPLFTATEDYWFERVDRLVPFLSFLNVRFALGPAGTPWTPGWRKRARGGGWELLENERVLPRAFAPRETRWGESAEERLTALAATTNFRRRAWLEPRTGPSRAPRIETNGPGDVVAIARRGSGYRVATRFERPGWVVVSTPAWRGWRAVAEGRELPLAFANHAFLAFEAPAGEHEVALFFRPRSFEIGLAVSAASFVALLAVAVRRSRRSTPSSR